jgi:bla regulator protein blaR1
MIPNFLPAIGSTTGAALGNHLWQSTLCLLVAGLLTLTLRKNHAGARYGLWLAASIKFLIPFSLLVSLGAHMVRPRSAAGMQTTFYFVMEEVSKPFTPHAPPVISPALHSAASPSLVHLLPSILAAIWLCGFVSVLVAGYARWRRVSAALRQAAPLREGREVKALRRAERVAGIRHPIDLLLSPSSLEPGILGIFKPVLVWPRGISEHLQDAHLEAILAHEVWHVRRRDNLAAAIHMLVEAVFWFHPLVWWLGSRLVDERERACDEEALRCGNEPRVYAESILKACQFCVESPLACVSGITGADLKQRIVRIMTQRSAEKLSFSRKLLLTGLGIAAIAGPVLLGLVNAPRVHAQTPTTSGSPTASSPPLSFEVASIKPNHSGDMRLGIMFQPGRFTTTGATVKQLIALSYDVRDFQVTGGPSWISSDKFDIDAKEPEGLSDELEKLSPDQRHDKMGMLIQSLLADRFGLKVSHATKDLPVYALVVAKGGPKLQEAKAGDTYPNGMKGPDGHPLGHGNFMRLGLGELEGQSVPVTFLAQELARQLGRNVLDQTGLKGSYDFTLKWAPDPSSMAMMQGPPGGGPPPGAGPAPDSGSPPDASGPSIFTAVQEQLGLKLESTKGPVDILIIDHVQQPSEN